MAQEESTPLSRDVYRGFRLAGKPCVERVGFHGHCGERHECVRRPAKFGARAAKYPRSLRHQRKAVFATRDHIHLAPERGYPEGMDYVIALQ